MRERVLCVCTQCACCVNAARPSTDTTSGGARERIYIASTSHLHRKLLHMHMEFRAPMCACVCARACARARMRATCRQGELLEHARHRTCSSTFPHQGQRRRTTRARQTAHVLEYISASRARTSAASCGFPASVTAAISYVGALCDPGTNIYILATNALPAHTRALLTTDPASQQSTNMRRCTDTSGTVTETVQQDEMRLCICEQTQNLRTEANGATRMSSCMPASSITRDMMSSYATPAEDASLLLDGFPPRKGNVPAHASVTREGESRTCFHP